MDEIEFEQSMQAARLANKESQVEPSSRSYEMTDLGAETCPGTSTSMDDRETIMNGEFVNWQNITFLNILFLIYMATFQWPTIWFCIVLDTVIYFNLLGGVNQDIVNHSSGCLFITHCNNISGFKMITWYIYYTLLIKGVLDKKIHKSAF